MTKPYCLFCENVIKLYIIVGYFRFCKSDLFALAVHIFALLMNGCHPFACAVDTNPSVANIQPLSYGATSTVVPQPMENICNGLSVFLNPMQGFATPLYAPSFSSLPIEIQNLFRQAFEVGFKNPQNRPNAEEWYRALDNMKNSLTVCKATRTHLYYENAGKSPWCEVKNKLEKHMRRQAIPIKPMALPQQQIPLNMKSLSNPSASLSSTPTTSSGSTVTARKGIMRTTGMFWLVSTTTVLGILSLFEFFVFPSLFDSGLISDFLN